MHAPKQTLWVAPNVEVLLFCRQIKLANLKIVSEVIILAVFNVLPNTISNLENVSLITLTVYPIKMDFVNFVLKDSP